MLPDLRRVKKELSVRVSQDLRNRARNDPFFKSISTHFMHEGDRMLTRRSDGTEDLSGLKEATGELVVRKEELAKFTGADRTAKLDAMSDQMTQQMTGHMLESISEITDKYGQTIDHAGKKFTVESIFAVLEKMELHFDENGKPSQLTFVGGEAASAAFQKALEELAASPELQARHEEIVQRKRQEFRDREADRKLVG